MRLNDQQHVPLFVALLGVTPFKTFRLAVNSTGDHDDSFSPHPVFRNASRMLLVL
jgi:hypothetical protein